MDSVTAALVDGRTYRVRWHGAFGSTVADTTVLIRIREDDVSGTVVQEGNSWISSTSTSGVQSGTEGQYTAGATGNKTFVITGLRNGGTGTLHAEGSSSRVRLLYVEYVEG